MTCNLVSGVSRDIHSKNTMCYFIFACHMMCTNFNFFSAQLMCNFFSMYTHVKWDVMHKNFVKKKHYCGPL